jgi:FkbM family methyltransferase
MKDFIQNNVSNVKGIIQVGANSGQEVHMFKELTNNIILIEPIPDLANHLLKTYTDTNCTVIQCGLGSENRTMVLNLASNNGESSSVLKPLMHPVHYPGIIFNGSIDIDVYRFDHLIDVNKIEISKYNVLVTDTQGFDLEAIKGFGSYISDIELIIAEYINSNLYEHESTLDDLTNYLQPLGFVLLHTFDENLGAGNAIFKKQ